MVLTTLFSGDSLISPQWSSGMSNAEGRQEGDYDILPLRNSMILKIYTMYYQCFNMNIQYDDVIWMMSKLALSCVMLCIFSGMWDQRFNRDGGGRVWLSSLLQEVCWTSEWEYMIFFICFCLFTSGLLSNTWLYQNNLKRIGNINVKCFFSHPSQTPQRASMMYRALFWEGCLITL